MATRFIQVLSKLHKILEGNLQQDILHWSSEGDCFIIEDQMQFAQAVLPDLCQHNNFASFVRQLNKYSFSKVNKQQTTEWIFRHEIFRSGPNVDLQEIRKKCGKPATQQSSTLTDAARRSLSPDTLSLPSSSPASSPAAGDTPERPFSSDEFQIQALQSQIRRMKNDQDRLMGTIRSLEQGYGEIGANIRCIRDAMALGKQLAEAAIQPAVPSCASNDSSPFTGERSVPRQPVIAMTALDSLATVAALALLHQSDVGNEQNPAPLDQTPMHSASAQAPSVPSKKRLLGSGNASKHGLTKSGRVKKQRVQTSVPESDTADCQKSVGTTSGRFTRQRQRAGRSNVRIGGGLSAASEGDSFSRPDVA